VREREDEGWPETALRSSSSTNVTSAVIPAVFFASALPPHLRAVPPLRTAFIMFSNACSISLPIFIGVVMLAILLVIRMRLPGEGVAMAVEGQKVSFARPALAARKLYLDLGANCGNSYDFFQTPSSQIKTLVTPGFEAFLFEPQPHVFQQWLVPLQKSVGDRMHIFNVAVATVNGTISFGIDALYASDICTLDGRGYPHGASSVYENIRGPGASIITVPTIDFGSFFANLHIQPADFVILKIDIEAQEYVILRQLQQDGLLCLVDELFVEWHNVPTEIIALDSEMKTFRERFEKSVGDCVAYYREWVV
jgi:FkbM family methyltransferase